MTATLLLDEAQDADSRARSRVARWCAAKADMIALAGEVGASGRWRFEGARSAADWFASHYKLSPSRCREWVKAARRLADRPVVAEALESGRLTPDQATPLLQHLEAKGATGDEQMVASAASASVPALVREARRATQVSREEAVLRHSQRSLSLTHNGLGGMWRISGLLADDDGAAVDAALTRKAEQMPVDPDTGVHPPWDVRMADALREVCGVSLAADKAPDLATVVVHVTEGRAPELHLGPSISDDTFCRVACDCRIQVLIEKANGDLLRATEVSRTVSAWLRRAVEYRDQGCTFPSCGRTRTLLHCHHIVHWTRDGLTTYDNLTTLCHVHHHAVHEGGWDIRRSSEGEAVEATRLPPRLLR